MAATGPRGSLACSTRRAASAPTSCCSPATPSTAIACRTSLIDRTAAVIAAAEIPVVLLPGNHDPVLPEAVFHRKSLAEVPNLHIIGLTHDEAIVFPSLDLEIWGRAHRDYSDMIPFETVRPRQTRWQIATAHGHYVPTPDRVTLAAAVVADRRRRASPPPPPTMWRSGIGIHRPRSAMARSRPITRARRNSPARSTWSGWAGRRARSHAKNSILPATPMRWIYPETLAAACTPALINPKL